ncbi:hypothetical protein NHX12_004131 [Muraenolepis orangiensis]|uniref:TGF-beta family profile domain-containing protein n=1 Tax=Muraenolepis orangiensis TaxID=630683 RepID=A0A9Q0DW63_9TELE|nr:hypothetical protein NHX12_004131 [Muraenolepis orangiensis]
MLSLLQPHRLPLVCVLLSFSLPRPGHAWPRVARDGVLDGIPGKEGGRDAARLLLLESVKAGILSSLGAEREPRPAVKASDEELRRMYGLYREKLRLLRGNSTEPMREVRRRVKKRRFTVLFPETVEPVKVIQCEGQLPESDQRIQWYRAVFNKNYNTHTDLTLVRAKLRISSWRWGAGQTLTSQEIHVKMNGMRLHNTTILMTGTTTNATASHHQDLSLDIRAGVEKWWRRINDTDEDNHPFVVEVGLAADQGGNLKAAPAVALEIGLARVKGRAGGSKRRRRRLPRSNEEDNCSEQGWCCRKSLTVSFKDIGWSDWVVAPVSYTMHYCDGSCPHNYKPASMHTQVKSRLHQFTKGATAGPCCVPSAYQPLVLMHYDSRGMLTMTPFQDLIVTNCHCA